MEIPPLHRERKHEAAHEQKDDGIGVGRSRFFHRRLSGGDPESRQQHEGQQRRRGDGKGLGHPKDRHGDRQQCHPRSLGAQPEERWREKAGEEPDDPDDQPTALPPAIVSLEEGMTLLGRHRGGCRFDGGVFAHRGRSVRATGVREQLPFPLSFASRPVTADSKCAGSPRPPHRCGGPSGQKGARPDRKRPLRYGRSCRARLRRRSSPAAPGEDGCCQ